MDIKNWFRKQWYILKVQAKPTDNKIVYPNNDPVDFVVTWVDGNDQAWQKERAAFSKETTEMSENGVGRYRAWSIFRYWFRAVEQYAPWVRHVYLVTWGHVPEWLNTECPKLKIVKHTDFIPQEFLPTFNSIPIELNLFRISDLSERFVYFNDDVFLARPVSTEDFFKNGKPKHTVSAYPLVNRNNSIPEQVLYNTYGVINKKNAISKCIENHAANWFSRNSKPFLDHNWFAYQNGAIPGFYFSHMGVPFCKTTMKKTWDKYMDECIYSSSCRFRDSKQIMHQLFSVEDILNGNVEPAEADWGDCILIENVESIRAAYSLQRTKMICLFDRDDLTNEEIRQIDKQLIALYETVFPEKSVFEK